MQILIRLPNWLGDVVMSAGFVRAVHQQNPGAHLHLITKAGLAPVAALLLPSTAAVTVHPFSKSEWRGPLGVWRFGRMLRQFGPFHTYYSLPNSFSAALLGVASGAGQRVGFVADGRRCCSTSTPKLRPAACPPPKPPLSFRRCCRWRLMGESGCWAVVRNEPV